MSAPFIRRITTLLSIVFIGLLSDHSFVRQVDSYPFSMEVDKNWRPLSESARETLRVDVENQIAALSERFYGINDSNFTHLPYFAAFKTNDAELTCIVQVLRIPPQVDYLKSISKDLEGKMEWGKKNGIIKRMRITPPERSGKFLAITLDAETPEDELNLTGMLFDEAMPYQVVQVTIMASPRHAAEARRGFDKILKTLALDFTVKSTAGKEPFVISNHCQEYWIVNTDIPGTDPKEVVLILQEPHWDYVGHWNLHQGLKVFFDDNPTLAGNTVFLAEGAKSLEPLSLESLRKADLTPTGDLIHAILQSYLVTGYMTYDWANDGKVPIVGIEDWALYQESAQRWLTDENAPWAVTVAARNHRMVETLTAMRRRYANPMMFVGGMHLHKIQYDLFSKGRATLPADSPSRTGDNQGITDILQKQGIRYIYIEPVPSTRAEEMSGGIEAERYRRLFKAQQNGDYNSYISGSAQAMRDLELFGELPEKGVTVSPNPEGAAKLVATLKQESGNGGDDDEPPKRDGDADEGKGKGDKDSPIISLSEIQNKTREFLRNLAKIKGLVPSPKNDPSNLEKSERFYDPKNKKKQRLRIDPGHKTESGVPYDIPNARVPHVHAYEPDGTTYIRDKDGDSHIPLAP